jgi:serine/threonine protein kinase
MPDENDILFARAALRAGLVDLDGLTEAIKEQAALSRGGESRPLDRILIGKGLITEEKRNRIRNAIRRHRKKTDIRGFEIYEVLGRGGMGTVYRARQLSMNRIVALKLLPKIAVEDPRDVKRFLREARLAASLNHRHVVKVFEVGEVEDKYFISMEHVTGQTLEEVVDQEGPLSTEPVLSLARKVAGALDQAHQKDVIHRDLKPGNIILTGDAELKIVDFGLAVGFGRGASQKITRAGILLGTPEYIAPEQARDPGSIDGRADIYSLGATMYHALAGDAPFVGDDVLDVLKKVFNRHFTPLEQIRPGLPVEVYELVDHLMAFKPSDRPTLGEIAEEVDRILGIYPGLSKKRKKGSKDTHVIRLDAPIPEGPEPRPYRIHGWQAVVLALVVVAFCFFVLVLLTATFLGDGEEEPAPGPRTGEGPDPSPQVPTSIQNDAEAMRLFEEARAFHKKHPDRTAEALTKLGRIVDRYPGTLGAYKARDEMERLRREEKD